MSLLAKASDSVNSFCLKLYAKLTENSQESKVFFSPASISVALAMIYAGTNGNTAREVEQLLNWNTPETVHEMMQNLQESILSSSGIELHLANRLWAQQEFAILKQYTDLLKSRYQTEMSTADFQGKSEEARKDINQWVEEKTNAKIKDILGPGVLNPHTKLVLVNAVYFKGLWEEVFLKEHSMDWNFKINTSNTCKVTLMHESIPGVTIPPPPGHPREFAR
jgi:serpin B